MSSIEAQTTQWTLHIAEVGGYPNPTINESMSLAYVLPFVYLNVVSCRDTEIWK
jgi:hypothetical protein